MGSVPPATRGRSPKRKTQRVCETAASQARGSHCEVGACPWVGARTRAMGATGRLRSSSLVVRVWLRPSGPAARSGGRARLRRRGGDLRARGRRTSAQAQRFCSVKIILDGGKEYIHIAVLLAEGRPSGGVRRMEQGAVPAGSYAISTRAASGLRPAGHYEPPARSSLTERRNASRKARPEAELPSRGRRRRHRGGAPGGERPYTKGAPRPQGAELVRRPALHLPSLRMSGSPGARKGGERLEPRTLTRREHDSDCQA